MSKQDVVIIGDGVAGLMSAYYLLDEKENITIINKSSNIEDKTSFGNAGLLSAFGKEPLSHPGVFMDTVKLFWTKQSAIFFKNILDTQTIKWIYQFFINSSKKNTLKTMSLFEKYGDISCRFYDFFQNDLGHDINYERSGFIIYYHNKKSYEKKKKHIMQNPAIGNILNYKEQNNIAPLLKSKIAQSILLYKNAHIDPEKTIKKLRNYLQDNGVNFVDNDEIIDFEFKDEKIKKAISINGNHYEAENFIMATGHNLALSKILKKKMILLPTRGYSATFKMDESLKPKVPILMIDKFSILTPRKDDVRITSRLEIGFNTTEMDLKKIDGLMSVFQNESFDMKVKDIKPWCGLRALTPNDKPLIGRDNKCTNMMYAMGLGWLGMTFSPAIGKIIADIIISNSDDNEDIRLFSGLS